MTAPGSASGPYGIPVEVWEPPVRVMKWNGERYAQVEARPGYMRTEVRYGPYTAGQRVIVSAQLGVRRDKAGYATGTVGQWMAKALKKELEGTVTGYLTYHPGAVTPEISEFNIPVFYIYNGPAPLETVEVTLADGQVMRCLLVDVRREGEARKARPDRDEEFLELDPDDARL